MSKKETIDVEKAAEELHELIREADVDTIAVLYENAFGAVNECWPSEDDPDLLVIEYVEGCEPNDM
ncbi:hypothetical protein LCGC14_2787530 [marine sediment metagenome]|uniref:Uncharacterized protein n=1 Tax=marine sediment metagenome TaxID=412755 RepID=A0A0F8ZDK5_9ZZZZ